MPDTIVQMNYERVAGVAKGFDQAGEIVQQVGQAVSALLESLLAAPFVGQAIAPRLTQWQQDIRNKSQQLIKKLNEMAKALRDAIEDHKRGDVAGKQYFMPGAARGGAGVSSSGGGSGGAFPSAPLIGENPNVYPNIPLPPWMLPPGSLYNPTGEPAAKVRPKPIPGYPNRPPQSPWIPVGPVLMGDNLPTLGHLAS